jgi:hypothetical protein
MGDYQRFFSDLRSFRLLSNGLEFIQYSSYYDTITPGFPLILTRRIINASFFHRYVDPSRSAGRLYNPKKRNFGPYSRVSYYAAGHFLKKCRTDCCSTDG